MLFVRRQERRTIFAANAMADALPEVTGHIVPSDRVQRNWRGQLPVSSPPGNCPGKRSKQDKEQEKISFLPGSTICMQM